MLWYNGAPSSMFESCELTDEDSDKLTRLRADISVQIAEMSAQQKEFGKAKDYDNARAISVVLKEIKSFEKVVTQVINNYGNSKYVGPIVHPEAEQLENFRKLEGFIFYDIYPP